MSTENTIPEVNSTWSHTNGNVYKVACITNRGSTRPEYPLTVVYFNVVNDTWWSRPVADWHRSMHPVSH
jgi:hypothetical protein